MLWSCSRDRRSRPLSGVVSPAAGIPDPWYRKNRVERVLGKDVFDVGEQQLLVLLFVMEAEDQDGLDFFQLFLSRFAQELADGLVDRRSETIGFGHSRPRDQPPQITPMHVARSVVVGIKQIGVFRNFRPIPRHPDFRDEGLKEPARVGQMPLRRANIGHRLHDEIFRLQGLAHPRAEIADLPVAFQQLFGLPARAQDRTVELTLAGGWLGHEGSWGFQKVTLLAPIPLCALPPSGRELLPLSHRSPVFRPNYRRLPRSAAHDARSMMRQRSIPRRPLHSRPFLPERRLPAHQAIPDAPGSSP